MLQMTHWIDFRPHKKFQDISLSGANNDANYNHVNWELYLYDVLTYISRVCISEQKHRIHTGLCENCLRFLDKLRGSVFAITHKCDLPTNWWKWFEIRKELLINYQVYLAVYHQCISCNMESLPSLHLRFYFQFWTEHWIIAGFGIQACCSSFSLLWG